MSLGRDVGQVCTGCDEHVWACGCPLSFDHWAEIRAAQRELDRLTWPIS